MGYYKMHGVDPVEESLKRSRVELGQRIIESRRLAERSWLMACLSVLGTVAPGLMTAVSWPNPLLVAVGGLMVCWVAAFAVRFLKRAIQLFEVCEESRLIAEDVDALLAGCRERRGW